MSKKSVDRVTRVKQFFLVVGICLLLFFGRYILEGISYLPVLYQLFFQKTISLKQSPENRINILLLGIGGGNHEGPNLTDTIIFASIDPASKSATLISIPRDLWIDMGETRSKINKVYSDGEEKKKGGGLPLVKAAVGRVVGQKIDYGFRLDFDGFIKAVDLLGGVDVDVERTLDDYAYPVGGKEEDACGFTEEEIASQSAQIATKSATESEAFPCRYEHLHIEKGRQHMDGVTALKFVRSRHALGAEGSDFARSKRQEKVIVAVKDKVFSVGTFLNPLRLTALYDTFKDSIDTDIDQQEYDDFIKLANKLQDGEVKSAVIDAGDEEREGLLSNPPISSTYGFQWVLIPTAGPNNYTEIQAFIKKELGEK